MRSYFDKQLSTLNLELVKMGALCEEAISSAAKCLNDGDKSLIDKIKETERLIDEKEREIESLSMKLLLHQQPVAGDLRMISAALRMISDMERIGDQAADIAEILKFVGSDSRGIAEHITDMATATKKMVTESVDSFVKRDLDMTRKVMKRDDTVDELFLKVKEELTKAICDNPEEGEIYLDILMIAKYFERIGDHAVNIAEWVEYSITDTHVKG